MIRKGIEQGFAEARDILASLQVLEGNILEDVDRTYELVQEGLNNFETEFRNTQGLVQVHFRGHGPLLLLDGFYSPGFVNSFYRFAVAQGRGAQIF